VLKPDVDLSGQDLFVGSTDNSLMQQHLGWISPHLDQLTLDFGGKLAN
jgi:hypothetical protein